jgi:hypothetical protein
MLSTSKHVVELLRLVSFFINYFCKDKSFDMKNYKFSTAFVTLYLIVYNILLRLEVSFSLSLFMFSLSPFLVVWMVYTILKYAPYNGRELKEDEEWAYGDKATKVSSNDY